MTDLLSLQHQAVWLLVWFINRTSFLLSVFCLGDCKRPQLIFPLSVFRKMQSFKKRKSSLQLGNFQSWKKASPVASSVFSGAFSSGICNIKSSGISKWTICKQFAANLPIPEVKQLCAVFSPHFSWSCSEIFGHSHNFFCLESEVFCSEVGNFPETVLCESLWAKELVPQLWQWQSGREHLKHILDCSKSIDKPKIIILKTSCGVVLTWLRLNCHEISFHVI